MNCKPGDLAVVTRVTPENHYQELKHLIGRVVKVVSITDAKGGPAWYYEGERLVAQGLKCNAVSDKWLKPLRDPGEDAVDEMLVIAGKPRKESVK